MNNENVLIFGDSYSTYEGHIPEGYAFYYPRTEEFKVCDVSKTWWGMLVSETNSKIVLNNSWSGSTMCNTGYDGDCSTSSSFIYRLSQLIENGFFDENKIDRVLVFGGTNDSWSGNKCGSVKFADWTDEDLFLVLPGISFFMHKLQSVIAKEKIHFIVNTELREEVTNGIIDICEYYGIGYTKLEDIEKLDGHPNYNGMVAIKNQVLSNLK